MHFWKRVSKWVTRVGAGDAVASKDVGKSLLHRAEAESADLVIFKDHFTLPTFKRPPQQLWMIYLLGKTSSYMHHHICTIIYSPSYMHHQICTIIYAPSFLISSFQNARSTLKSSSRKTFSTGRRLTEGTVPSLPRMKGFHWCYDDTFDILTEGTVPSLPRVKGFQWCWMMILMMHGHCENNE